jgi:tetratricopeptide (TPR) repeat protein/CHAT domain-containing protein
VQRLLALKTPPQSPLEINLRAYHDEGKRRVRSGPFAAAPEQVDRPFRVGERVRFGFQASRACHVVLIDVDTTGTVAVIWPNVQQKDPRIEGGRPVFFPDPEAAHFPFLVAGPAGIEHVVAIASLVPLPVPLLPAAGKPFRELTAEGVEQVVGAVGQLEPTEWAAAVCAFPVEGAEAGRPAGARDPARQAEIGALNLEAGRLYRQGRYEQALAAATRVCDLMRTQVGESQPEFAFSLSNLALLYHALGNYATAEPLLRQAMEIVRMTLGEWHPSYAAALGNLAGLFKALGDYARARPLLETALEITRNAVGEGHPSYAAGLENLGELYGALGDYARARPLLETALEITRNAVGEGHPSYAAGLNNLAVIHEAMGDYAAAAPLLLQALEITRQALGEDHADYATRLSNLAALYQGMDNYAAAEPLYRQALEITRNTLGEDHPSFAGCLHNLAELYLANGSYRQALALLQQALEIQRAVLGDKHPASADTLNNLARARLVLGDLDVARQNYSEALALYRGLPFGNLGVYRLRTANTLTSLGGVQCDLGDLAGALQSYHEALELYRQLGQEQPASAPKVAGTLSLIGAVQAQLGQFEAAQASHAETVQLFREAAERHPEEYRPPLALALSGLGAVQAKLGKLNGARDSYLEALAIYRQLAGQAPQTHLSSVASTLNDLGRLEQAAQDYPTAVPYFTEAVQITQGVLGEDHPETAASLHNLGSLFEALGDHAAARPYLERALAIRRHVLGEAHPDTAATLAARAALAAAQGHAADAFDLMQQVAAIDDRVVGQTFSTHPARHWAAPLQRIRRNLELFLSLVVRHLAHSRVAVQSACELVLRRKAIWAEALTARRDAVLRGRYPELEPKLRELAALRMQRARATLAGPGSEGPETHRHLLAEWNGREERLETELARTIPDIDLEQKLRSADRRAVTANLPEGAILVEFIRFDVFDFEVGAAHQAAPQPARYLAFTLLAGDPDDVQLIDLGDAESLDRLAHQFRAGITAAEVGVAAPDGNDGVALRRRLFDPVAALAGGRRQILIAPDGDLALLPFEVLPTDDGRYLVEDYRFSYLGTGRDVLRFGAVYAERAADPVVIADPDFDLREPARSPAFDVERWLRNPIARLPGTRIEGERVAALLGVRPWLGEAALEGRLKACRSPWVLHLATHGFFLQHREPEPSAQVLRNIGVMVESRMRQMYDLENPLLRSGLALAGANTWLAGGTPPALAEDGLLTAEDVLGMDLLDTELVVLSASESGLGEVQAGEGVLGLRRAFALAGAKTVVMSFWAVPDEQTADLMEAFYVRLLTGRPRGDALHEAQLALKAKHPHPFFWGGFICQGDVSPLPDNYTPADRYRSFVEADNPYVVGQAVAGRMFVGRDDVLKMIRDNLAPAAGKNILVLRGQRRTGKTSVLLRLRDTLPGETGGAYLPVLVSVQALMMARNEGQFFYHLARRFQLEVQRHGVEVPKPVAADFDRDPAGAFELEFLDQVAAALGQRRVLLMLDEFEKLKELIDQGRLGSAVLDYCRHLMQHTSLLFLIAGTQKLRELTGKYWSVFFNLAVPIDIGALKAGDARRLITEPVRQWYAVNSSAQNEIIGVSGCHPYFTQLVCRELVGVRNESHLNQMSRSHVREAVERALATGADNIGYPWTDEDCTADERLVLAVLAQQGEEGAPLSADQVRGKLQEARASAAVGEAATRLHARGVLRRDEQGAFTFTVPLFAKWIVREGYATPRAAARYNEEHPLPLSFGGSSDD